MRAFGAAMFQDQVGHVVRCSVAVQKANPGFSPQAIDYRFEFSKWGVNEFTVKLPGLGLIFDYFIDPETKQWTPCTERVPKFELDPGMPLQATINHTPESRRACASSWTC